LIAEVGSGGTNSAGQSQYIYLPTGNGPMPVAAVVNGSTYAVHSDHLNTPRRLTNADGQAVWQWGYSAFGEDKPTTAKNRFANLETTTNPGTTSISEVKFNLRYPGQYADEESGLNYNYFRSYDTRTGRYSQPDPIGLDGGWNRFGYVYANPLSFTDPLGLDPKYEKPPNPNKRPPPDHRIPGSERERNVGHPDGEEHSKNSKKQRASGLKGARGARGVGGLLLWDIINEICDETPGVGGCEVIKPPPPPPNEQLCLKEGNGDDTERKIF
ncbi:RHS repeat-associated core domain-containing protein, partial [Variovorax sp. YR266]|uniref:RHS repeat domain-containing protein n=1 Tax=Variovorax sp. YR266 TaxID=1884386 RepID=UPI000899F4F5